MKRTYTNFLTFTFISILIFGLIGENPNSLTSNNLYPEPDSVYAKYFLLKVGNSYTYFFSSNALPPIPSYYYKAKITKDSTIGGKKYFYCQSFPFVGTGWVRYDSVAGVLLKRSTTGGCSIYPNDIILDSMKSKINDQISCTYQGTGFMLRKCLDTATMTFFSMYQRKSINFQHDGIIYGMTRYAKDFGITNECTGEPPPCIEGSVLKGCVLNGIVYGDTTMTNIRNVNSTVPENYSLSQNYPNPFNPATIIKFQIPNLSFQHVLSWNPVKLVVYDILGKEVVTLVNEVLKTGEYEVTFDGSDLPSGIYFYTLSTDNFKETKKMLMIK